MRMSVTKAHVQTDDDNKIRPRGRLIVFSCLFLHSYPGLFVLKTKTETRQTDEILRVTCLVRSCLSSSYGPRPEHRRDREEAVKKIEKDRERQKKTERDRYADRPRGIYANRQCYRVTRDRTLTPPHKTIGKQQDDNRSVCKRSF